MEFTSSILHSSSSLFHPPSSILHPPFSILHSPSEMFSFSPCYSAKNTICYSAKNTIFSSLFTNLSFSSIIFVLFSSDFHFCTKLSQIPPLSSLPLPLSFLSSSEEIAKNMSPHWFPVSFVFTKK